MELYSLRTYCISVPVLLVCLCLLPVAKTRLLLAQIQQWFSKAPFLHKLPDNLEWIIVLETLVLKCFMIIDEVISLFFFYTQNTYLKKSIDSNWLSYCHN